MCGHRAGRAGRRLQLPDATSPRLNYSVLTGTLIADPRLGRSPVGDPVTLLQIEFPVTDPERPQLLWTWARFDVEVPAELGRHYEVQSLKGGTAILASGQLSERWVIENGRSSRRGVIVADLVQPDAPDSAGGRLAPLGRRR